MAAGSEAESRATSAATGVHFSRQHLDRLDALSRPTLGFPADVMREASVVAGVYGAQLPDIDDPRAQAVAPHHHCGMNLQEFIVAISHPLERLCKKPRTSGLVFTSTCSNSIARWVWSSSSGFHVENSS